MNIAHFFVLAIEHHPGFLRLWWQWQVRSGSRGRRGGKWCWGVYEGCPAYEQDNHHPPKEHYAGRQKAFHAISLCLVPSLPWLFSSADGTNSCSGEPLVERFSFVPSWRGFGGLPTSSGR